VRERSPFLIVLRRALSNRDARRRERARRESLCPADASWSVTVEAIPQILTLKSVFSFARDAKLSVDA